MRIKFEEMQVYDFSNLDLQEDSDSNCFCDGCDCDTCDTCQTCDACDRNW